MKNSNNYKIHTTQQLIDINSNLNKFSAEINITSKNEDDEFDILVVTQTELDNIDFEQNYKRIKHTITINVDSDDGNTDNYVLVIKSEKETEVNITIDLKDLDSKSVDTPPPPVIENNPQQNVRKNNGEGFVTKLINFLRKYFFVIILLILLACFAYIYFIKKMNKIQPNDTYIPDTNLNTELLNKIDSNSNLETPQLQTTFETPQLDTSVAQPVVQPAPQPLQTSVAQPVVQPAPQPLQTSVAQPVVQPAPQPVVQPAPQPVVQPAPAPLQTSITQSPQLETNLVQSHSSSVSDSVRDMSNSSGVSSNRDSILERLRNIRKN